MFSKDKIFSYIFLFSLFPGQIVSCNIFKSADELACLLLLILAAMEFIANGRDVLRRLLPLWITFGIMAFYVFYSIVFRSFNTPKYVVIDMVSQVKPFVAYIIVYCLGLHLTKWARQVGRWLCIINVIFMVIFYVWGHGQLMLPFAHISYLGTICMISGLFYLYCSIDDDGKISVRDMCTTILILTFGLVCGRSKYFGEFILTICLFILYRPGLFRSITLRHFLVAIGLLVIVVLAAWQKIYYYFVQGFSDMIQNGTTDAMSDSYARPILYVTGWQILQDYFPFGSGLASFASYASAENYSELYYEYGLDKVWGLSPYYNSFICDAYYPTLSQFGFFGICCFACFWRWLYKPLAHYDLTLGNTYSWKYAIGMSLLVFLIIESIGGTQFIQAAGFQTMMFLGLLATDQSAQHNNS